MVSHWPRPIFYFLTLLVFGIDQATKAWAMASLRPIETVTLIPGFFSLTYVQNTGIAFGMFAGQGLLVGLFVTVLILFALYQAKDLNWASWEPNIVGSLICGGALGNLIDRARHGWVIDFFDIHVTAIHFRWPVFNVADSVICIAVGWIVLRQLTTISKPKEGQNLPSS